MFIKAVFTTSSQLVMEEDWATQEGCGTACRRGSKDGHCGEGSVLDEFHLLHNYTSFDYVCQFLENELGIQT